MRIKKNGASRSFLLQGLEHGNEQRLTAKHCTEYSTDPRYDCSGDTQPSEITAVLGGIACRYTDKARDNRDCTNKQSSGEQIDKN